MWGAGQISLICQTFSMLYLMFVCHACETQAMQEDWIWVWVWVWDWVCTANTALTWANREIQMNPGWRRQSEVVLQVALPVCYSSVDPDCPFLPPAAEFLKTARTFLHKLGTKCAPVPASVYSKTPTLIQKRYFFLNSCSAGLLELIILKIIKLFLLSVWQKFSLFKWISHQ